jgi:hypothetical protein
MELAIARQALDRRHLATLAADRERQAGQHASPVHPHRAGAARALITPLLRPGQIEVLPQGVEQAHPRLQVDHAPLTVDR